MSNERKPDQAGQSTDRGGRVGQDVEGEDGATTDAGPDRRADKIAEDVVVALRHLREYLAELIQDSRRDLDEARHHPGIDSQIEALKASNVSIKETIAQMKVLVKTQSNVLDFLRYIQSLYGTHRPKRRAR